MIIIMNLNCNNCIIQEEKVCDECKDFETCVQNGMDFKTLRNAPNDFPDCFKCKYNAGLNCTAEC